MGLLQRPKNYVKAVNGINLTVSEGETLGVVGESGCGKSTLGRVVIGLEKLSDGSINLKMNQLVIYQKEN